jgi:hypothetical protein
VGKYAFSHWHDIYSSNYDGDVSVYDCVELIVLWQQQRKLGNKGYNRGRREADGGASNDKDVVTEKQLLQRRCLW